MTDDIQNLIAAASPDDDARLDATEAAVWMRVDEIRERRRVTQVRVAAVVLALMIGAVNGGSVMLMSQPQPSEMRVFSVSAGLSPLAGVAVLG